MAFFEFPHTRTYDSDLGWLINAFNEISEKLDTYLENAVIKFADPITWDITEQYTALTMVVDSDGTAYLSKQPVPAGIAISNTDYWLPIFNYDDNINQLRDQIAYNARSSATTGVALTTGDLVFWNGLIYIVLTDMPAGTAFLPGTNIDPYTVDSKINDYANAISVIQTDITNINTELDALSAPPMNIILLGAKNDGSEDVSGIINQYTASYTLYAPAGLYRLDYPVTLQNGLYGAGSDRLSKQTTVFYSNFDLPQDLITGVANPNGTYEIKHFTVDADAHSHPNIINANAGICKITDIAILNVTTRAVSCDPSISSSRMIYINGLMINGYTGYYSNSGLFVGANAHDSMFTNLEIMACKNGITLQGNGHRISNAHIWCGTRMGSDDGSWFSGTRGITISGTGVMLDNVQLDTAYLLVTILPNATAIISNVVCMTDNTASPSIPSAYIEIRDKGHVDISNLTAYLNSSVLTSKIFNDLNTEISGYSVSGLYILGMPAIPYREILPTCTGPLKDLEYHLSNNNVQYKEIASFVRMTSTGNISLDIVLNVSRAHVDIQLSSSAITACQITTFGGSFPNIYYKIANNQLKLFMQTASDVYVKLYNSATTYITPINISCIRDYSREVASSGLTQLTNI